MRAAGLHPIATLMETQAVLIRSTHPSTTQSPQPELIELISRRLSGVIAASRYVLCNYNIPRSAVADAVKITPGRRAATVAPLEDGDWCAVSSMVLKKDVAGVMDRLQEAGACDILIVGLSNCRV